MIAKARVYLNQDRTRAVPEGHKDARFLLAAEGTEIADATLDKYAGAKELVSGEAAEAGDDIKQRVAARLKEQELKRK